MRGGLADHSAGAPLFIEQDCTFRHRKEQFVKNFVKRQKKHPGKGDIERNYIFRRLTDQFVKEKARKNTILEVGADKIARTTHWALSLLEELRTSRRKIPLAWRQGQISGVKAIEVYPATVLPVLSLDVNTSYKTGESAPANRGDILNKLKSASVLFLRLMKRPSWPTTTCWMQSFAFKLVRSSSPKIALTLRRRTRKSHIEKGGYGSRKRLLRIQWNKIFPTRRRINMVQGKTTGGRDDR